MYLMTISGLFHKELDSTIVLPLHFLLDAPFEELLMGDMTHSYV